MMPALHPDFAILDVGGTEILIIMVITLLLFGSERLPGLARSMGKSIREFKKATSGLEEELRRALETPPAKMPVPPTAPFQAPGPPAATPQPLQPPPAAPPPASPPPPPGDFPYP